MLRAFKADYFYSSHQPSRLKCVPSPSAYKKANTLIPLVLILEDYLLYLTWMGAKVNDRREANGTRISDTAVIFGAKYNL